MNEEKVLEQSATTLGHRRGNDKYYFCKMDFCLEIQINLRLIKYFLKILYKLVNRLDVTATRRSNESSEQLK